MRWLREQVAVLVNRAALDRDVGPERGQRRLEPGCAVDEGLSTMMNSGALRPRRVLSSRKAVQAAVLLPPMFLSASRTFYKWRSRFGGMVVSDAKRLRALEDGKLKRLLADAMLDVSTLREMLGKNF